MCTELGYQSLIYQPQAFPNPLSWKNDINSSSALHFFTTLTVTVVYHIFEVPPPTPCPPATGKNELFGNEIANNLEMRQTLSVPKLEMQSINKKIQNTDTCFIVEGHLSFMAFQHLKTKMSFDIYFLHTFLYLSYCLTRGSLHS